MIKASIDIGSNTVQFLLGEFKGSTFKQIIRKQFVTSLGKNLDQNKKFDNQSMIDTKNALSECVIDCNQYKIETSQIIATATEASRVAQNSSEFFKEIKKELNLDVMIISAADEALYSVSGLLFNAVIKEKNIAVIDIGGASTEITRAQVSPFQLTSSISLPVGSVRLNAIESKEEKLDRIETLFNEFDVSASEGISFWGVAGTFTSLAIMSLGLKEYCEKSLKGFYLTKDDIKKLGLEISSLNEKEILAKYPFLGKRAKVIKEGQLLVSKLMTRLNLEKIAISVQGLVYGTISLENKDFS